MKSMRLAHSSFRPAPSAPQARRAAALLLIAWLSLAAGAQILVGDVAGIGFKSSGDEQFAIRYGQWIPIQLNLSVQGSEIFTGTARIISRDLDGDYVAWQSATFNITPNAPPQRVWLYAMANDERDLANEVEIVSKSGASVARLPLPTFQHVTARGYWVLDISGAKVSRLGSLSEQTDSDTMLTQRYRPVKVSLHALEDMPDRWIGLEAIDAIVWDRPEPGRLRPSQMDALLEWVRRGGQLVVGVGPNWNDIRTSKLAEIMPLAGDGQTITVERLRALFSYPGMAARTTTSPADAKFRQPISLTTAGLADGAVCTLRDLHPAGGVLPLISMRLVGAGRVTATAASLSDLASGPVLADALFLQMLELNRYSPSYLDKSVSISAAGALADRTSLFDGLIKPINFSEQTLLRGLAALMFVAAYFFVATFGSWWYLQRQKRVHLSWTIFAIFAVGASALSLLTVTALRGVSRGVSAAGLLDFEAGARTASGTCLFGYRSPLRQSVTLKIEGENAFLRPLARGSYLMSSFATALRYRGEAGSAELLDTPMRATLKQFEAHWRGDLDGTIRADLSVVQQRGTVTPESFVINELPVTVEGGFLLYVDPRHVRHGQYTQPLSRATGREVCWNEHDPRIAPPARSVVCLSLGRIERDGGRLNKLGEKQFAAVDEALASFRETQPARERPDLPTLWREQQQWAGTYSLLSSPSRFFSPSLPEDINAILLASTWCLHLSTSSEDYDSAAVRPLLHGVPKADVTHGLIGGTDATGARVTWGVLLLWSNTPPPARLVAAGAALRPSAGRTLYRVRVPIKLVSGVIPSFDVLGAPFKPAQAEIGG